MWLKKCCIVLNCWQPSMLVWCSELLGDEKLTTKIMETTEQKELMMLQRKMTLPDHLVQQWFDGLKRILHESNTAKVTDMQEPKVILFLVSQSEQIHIHCSGICCKQIRHASWCENRHNVYVHCMHVQTVWFLIFVPEMCNNQSVIRLSCGLKDEYYWRKGCWNRNVFSWCWNDHRVDAETTSLGSVF